jgi:hypothetical protein
MLSQTDQSMDLARSDRRRHPRVAIKSPVKARRKDLWMDSKKLVCGECENLSMGGVLFTSEEDFPIGTLLQLGISLDGWNRHHPGISSIWEDGECTPLKVTCEVLRTETEEDCYHVAARFLDMQPYDFIGLQSFLMDCRQIA